MTIDHKTPVILGAGQFTEFIDAHFEGLRPEAMAAHACERAIEDTGSGKDVRKLIDTIACVRLFAHSVPDEFRQVVAPFGSSESPPLSIIARLGIPEAQAIYSRACGDEPQRLVYELGEAVATGAIRAGLICGAEAIATQRHFQRSGQPADWSEKCSGVTDDRGMCTEFTYEQQLNRHGAYAPVDIYPLLEQARRLSAGLTSEEYCWHMADLMSRFSEVAARNPHSMFRDKFNRENIATKTDRNRMIGDPHLKSMVAKDGVNQAAALVITSLGVAKSLNVSDRAIFLRGHAEEVELPVLERPSLDKSPAMQEAYRSAIQCAGVTVEDIMAFDLYSCFPIAVFAALESLGLRYDDSRPFTLTGGLPYFGGAGNNYSTHGIAEMLNLLRKQREPSFGLVGANGGFLSKHAVGVYSNAPGDFPVLSSHNIRNTDAVKVEDQPSGSSTVESYTIRKRGDKLRIVVVGRLEQNNSRWVGIVDPSDEVVRDWFLEGDPLGARVMVRAEEKNIVGLVPG